MERLLLKPCHEMTTAQCVIECCGYLRTIANQEYNGEEWETAPKYRRQNLITDLLCNIELSGDEFAELCALIGFSIDKVTKQRLSKFMVIAYDYKAETSGTPNAETMATLDKCAGVTLIEERGYHPQGKTFDRIRMMLAGFWHCLLNELRYLCLSVGCVIEPTETADTPAETPRISTETEQITNQSTNTPKPQETARKLPKSVIRNCLTAHVRQKLGAQGYSMLADASATLAAINAPPIRGDCALTGRGQRIAPTGNTR